ncbi:MAG: CRTAC1 family protein [Acidobacteriota bacterium]|nr:CRTAC1 family protein [Acidobacteriota bacterium]
MSAVAHIDEYKTGKFYQDEFRGDLSWNGYENNVLLRNEGNDANGVPHFLDVGQALGADDIGDARGMATADFDNDGDLDIIINNNPGDNGRDAGVPPVLLRNDVGQGKNWLAVKLEGRQANRDAVGAEVTIRIGDQQQVRLVGGGSGYAGQITQRLYFGLGNATRVDSLTVRWPGGEEENFQGQDAGRLLVITQGEGLQTRQLPALKPASKMAGAQRPAEAEGGR